MNLEYNVAAGFDFAAFLAACTAGGVSLQASSPSDSPNGAASLGGGVLSVTIYATSYAPSGSGPSSIPGGTAPADMSAAKAAVDAAVNAVK